jgi:hypothetical protein
MRLLLCSLIALTSAEIARAQSGLGAPVASDLLPAAENRTSRPILSSLGPARSTTLMPPQITAENPIVPATKEDVARLIADGASLAEISAAKIKLDQSQVKSRQAAVRYLALVDCHFYPEAEAGLIAALRADRNEGVRYEAALALGTSRCVSRRMVDALTIAALGHVTDGHPAETSERVRAAAHESLTRVLAHGIPGEYLPRVSPATEYIKPLLPQIPTITVQERRLAETVGTTKSQTGPDNSKSLFPWLQSMLRGRDTSVDPRLRGLSVGVQTPSR